MGQKYTNISELSQEGWTITKGWPDLLYFNEHEDGTIEAVFITNRSSSRQFTMEKAATLRIMEELGLNVRINSNGTLLTIDEFEHSGMGSLSSHGVQTIYNYRRELKMLKFQLEQLTEDDPRHFQLQQRVVRKQRIVNNYEKDKAAFDVKPAAEVNNQPAAKDDNPMVEYSNRLNRLLHRMRAKGREKEWLDKLQGLRTVAIQDQDTILKQVESELDNMEKIVEQETKPVSAVEQEFDAIAREEAENVKAFTNPTPPADGTVG